MPALHPLHAGFLKSLHHNRHPAKLSIYNHTRTSQLTQHDDTDAILISQLPGLLRRAKMVKVDSQAGIYSHLISDLPGRRFLVPPWLAILAWMVIFVFIGLTIAGFILAYQARKEFRMRVEEQRKLLENQASDDECKIPISRKELKSFTRKSIMVLNSGSQEHTSPYRISVAGHIMPRNVFDRPSRDSILVAQITPRSDSFSDDSYYEFSRQAARESFWDPALRKSVMSVASVSSMMSKIQKRKSVGFAMIEQLDEQALEGDRPQRRQHQFRQGSNLRVQDHAVQNRRFVPPVPTRMSPSITFTDSIEPATPYPPPTTADEPSETPSVVPELAKFDSNSTAPISADEALAQYAASRSTTPVPSQASRSNSLLRLVRRSLTSQLSSAALSQISDPLTPKNDGDIAVMQPMHSYNEDSAGTLSNSLMNHAVMHLQPSAFTHSVIFEDDEDYFSARQEKNSAMLMNSGANNVQPMNIPLPRRLPHAVLNSDKSATVSPASSSAAYSTSSNIRPRLKISPVSASTTCDDVDSTMSHSNSKSSVTNPYGRRNNKIELPASPRDGMSSPGSTTGTYKSFSSLVPHSTTASSVSSHDGCHSDKEHDSYRSDLNSTPSLTLKRLPSLSTNPYARRKRQSNSQTNPHDELRMVRLKNRHENLKRNLSNPIQVQPIQRNPPASLSSTPVRRTASAQARLPLGGTMSSGGVRDSSFIP